MKVIDIVPFFNEVDILQARVALLDGHIDEHIVVEAHQTHQGDPKPLHLDGVELPEQVKRYAVHLPGRSGDDMDWQRERWQRDQAACFLGADIHTDDLILSCDVDELINPAALPAIVEATKDGPVRLGMRMLYYGLDWEDPTGWAHPVAFRGRACLGAGPQLSWMRTQGTYPVLPGCGWHVSYWGGVERRRQKVEAFAHRENRDPETWARIESGPETGTGPNGEQLTKVDPATIPDALRGALGVPVA